MKMMTGVLEKTVRGTEITSRASGPLLECVSLTTLPPLKLILWET